MKSRILHYITLAVFSCVVSACGGTSKIKNIVEFTPKLQSETSEYNILLSSQSPSTAWNVSTNWVNTQPRNFAIPMPHSNKFISAKSFKHLIAHPVIAQNHIIILSDNAVVTAFDIESNKTIWSNNLNLSSKATTFSGGGMIVHEGVLFVTHATRDLVAIDIVDGRELWRRQLPDIVKTQPIIYQNMLLLTTISNQLCAMDIPSGVMLWVHEGLPENLSYGHNISPVIFRDSVLVGYSSGQLALVDAKNGQEIWQMNLAKDVDGLAGFIPLSLDSQPIIHGDLAYISSASGLIMKINLVNGSVYWQRKIQDIQSMNKSGNTLFITTNAKQVAALSEASGVVLWATDLEPGHKKKYLQPVQFLTPVIVNDELVVIGSNGKIYYLAPSDGVIIRTVDIAKHAESFIIDNVIRIFTKTHMLVSK